MSSTLDDRKNAFENKFAHDQQLQFRAEARTSKLFGQWVAEQMGLTGAEAAAYATSMVEANLHEVGFSDIQEKARADLAARGKTDITEAELQVKIDACFAESKRQIMEEAVKN